MENNDHEKDILRPNQDNRSGEGLQKDLLNPTLQLLNPISRKELTKQEMKLEHPCAPSGLIL
jgi:hypothetical protein